MSQLNKFTEKSKCFRQMLVVAVSLLVFVALLSEQAFAHSFAYYASTPITPPIEFLWWFPISMCLLVLGTYFPLRMSLKWSHLYALFVALLWVAIFTVVFFFIGCAAAGANTAPPPGLGAPCPTFWGRTFLEVGFIFLYWNFFGLCLFMARPFYLLLKAGMQVEKPGCFAFWSWVVSIPICCMIGLDILGLFLLIAGLLRCLFKAKKLENPKPLAFWWWVIPVPLCFTLGLTPYIATGAWVHGWGGGYVGMGCRSQIGDLHQALVLYALDHDNRLPAAKDYAGLYPQIESYLERNIDFCVIGNAWERTPQPFIWNNEFSGREVFRTTEKSTLEQDITEPVVYFEPMQYGRFSIRIVGGQWVDCPYAYNENTYRPAYTHNVLLPRNIPQEILERLCEYRELADFEDALKP